jgi:hypothetical protein
MAMLRGRTGAQLPFFISILLTSACRDPRSRESERIVKPRTKVETEQRDGARDQAIRRGPLG